MRAEHVDCVHAAGSINSEDHHRFFTGTYERRVFPGVGHNPPQEAPRDFAEAVLSLG